ncbi:MAG: histidine kinase dimerization/phospho-acceptor domain-containing protein [Luteolibacter sp.]
MNDFEHNDGELFPWKQVVAKSVHDMRTPLSCIRTTVEVLRMISAGSEKHGRLIAILDKQVDELSSQMETLLKNPDAFLHLPQVGPHDE